jgi:hypothetical protein
MTERCPDLDELDLLAKSLPALAFAMSERFGVAAPAALELLQAEYQSFRERCEALGAVWKLRNP